MIEKLWAIWITGILQPSLPHDILLELRLTERPAMVTRTLDLYVQRPDLADEELPSGTQLIDVFDRLDRAILILGAPGAGKTTLLLTLARDLLQRAAPDPEQAIPVIFPLSSWGQQRQTLPQAQPGDAVQHVGITPDGFITGHPATAQGAGLRHRVEHLPPSSGLVVHVISWGTPQRWRRSA